MDWLRGVGNWFGGLFGKKKEEEKPPVQAPRQVVFKQPTRTASAPNVVQPSAPNVLQPQPKNQFEFPKTPNYQEIMKNTTPTASSVDKSNPYRNNLNQSVPQRMAQFEANKHNIKPTPKQETKPEPKKPGFLDYLNPAGKHGLFGNKQQHRFNQTIAKPVTKVADKYEKFIDKGDKQEGFQWSDPMDYLRFGAKLPSGMARGMVEAPGKLSAGMTGQKVDEAGKVHKLNKAQRLGSFADGYISLRGLPMGGSGVMLRSLAPGVRNVVSRGVGKAAFDLGKSAAVEGTEEFVQAMAEDLADDGKLNSGFGSYLQAGAQGALGGGMMHGAGVGISGLKRRVGDVRGGGLKNAYADASAQRSSHNPYRSNADVRYKFEGDQSTNPEVHAYNDHINQLRLKEKQLLDQGLDENSAPVINNRKAQAAAIEARSRIGQLDENGIKYKLTDDGLTQAQREYFKGSRVRNDRGELTKMYHSTDVDFDQVNPDMFKNGWLGKGFYTTPNEGLSQDFGRHTKELYVDSKNPYIAEADHPSGVLSELQKRFPDDNIDNFNMAEVLKDKGYDGIKMNHWDQGEIVSTFDPHQVKYTDNLNPTRDPDMRYSKEVENSVNQQLITQSEALNRHLRLTGDEQLVFNVWQDTMQERALGYYDPSTDTINLNKLTEDTLNHELGHKLLNRAANKAELLADIRQTYGDDALIEQYGDKYGTNDINLLAEEKLADGFSEYYEGRLQGVSVEVLGRRLNIPPRVIALYDRIAEAVRGLVGKQDVIRQFYAQAETGKFRSDFGAVMDRGGVLAHKIADFNGKDAVYLDDYITDRAPRGMDDRSYIRNAILEKFKGKNITLSDNSVATVGRQEAGKLAGKSYKGQPANFIDAKLNSSMYVDELGATMRNIKESENIKNPKTNAPSYIKGDVTIISRGVPYQAELVIRRYPDGSNRIYDVLIQKEITPSRVGVSAEHRVIRGDSDDNLTEGVYDVKCKHDTNQRQTKVA